MSENQLRIYDTVYLITVDTEEVVRLPAIDEITRQESIDRSIKYGRNICVSAADCKLYGKARPAEDGVSIVVGCRVVSECDGEAIRRAKDHIHEALAAYTAVDSSG